MNLIVGLGNPGNEYTMTRHNVGFLAIDRMAQRLSASPYRNEHKGLVTKCNFQGKPFILLKPQTFMNLSGESVRPLMEYYKINQENLLVIHDEVDLPFAAIRYQKNRGHGGHNGIRNIHQLLGSNEYSRLKLGVSRPSNPKQNVADFVLQNFSKEEQSQLDDYLNEVCDSLECYLVDGFEKAATRFNRT